MEANAPSQPRPMLVTTLAIFTIIGVVAGFCLDGLKQIAPELTRYDAPLPAWITVPGYVLALGKLVAAILLLQMRRVGFYIYAACESLLAVSSIIGGKIGMDYLDSGFSNPNIPIDPAVLMMLLVGIGLGLSIAFIGGYAAHLSRMR